METIDLHLYNALVNKIALCKLTPEYCGVCNPQCAEYKVKLFSKEFTLEISTHDTVLIYSRSIPYCTIVFKLETANAYNELITNNEDL